ncbi:MAG: ParB N-terminal domain-containing protein [Desulfocapsaceae bacterium]|jgi:ParB family chromosome partitioning protein|nr:ParB N-terminal domain-containing protein [Desulfocapsaceae bacterium]
MKVAIDKIIVEESLRIRKDIGNLDVLQSSIEKVGLINPVMIDENYKLLAGYRRLSACKNLGWKDIEANVVQLNGDLIKMLDVEIAENFFRKDFTPEEILATEQRRREILEQQRKKGFFEKFWAWVKRLFLPTPQ